MAEEIKNEELTEEAAPAEQEAPEIPEKESKKKTRKLEAQIDELSKKLEEAAAELAAANDKYLRLAGFASKGISVHKLRHTAATLMFQSGNVDIRVLKDILGHEQLNTTQIYTHVVDRNMQEAMRQNPLSNISIQRNEDEE